MVEEVGEQRHIKMLQTFTNRNGRGFAFSCEKIVVEILSTVNLVIQNLDHLHMVQDLNSSKRFFRIRSYEDQAIPTQVCYFK